MDFEGLPASLATISPRSNRTTKINKDAVVFALKTARKRRLVEKACPSLNRNGV